MYRASRCRGDFIINGDGRFGIQMLRTRIDVERSDKRESVVEHGRLCVQRIGPFVFPKIDAETQKFFLRGFVTKLHEHRVIRGNRVGYHFYFCDAALFHNGDVSQQFLCRNEIRRFNHDRSTRAQERLPQFLRDAKFDILSCRQDRAENQPARLPVPGRSSRCRCRVWELCLRGVSCGSRPEFCHPPRLRSCRILDLHGNDFAAVPKLIEVSARIGDGFSVHVNVAIDEVAFRITKVIAFDIAPAADHAFAIDIQTLVVHPAHNPAEFSQRNGMINFDRNLFLLQVRVHRRRNLVRASIDNDADVATSARGIAQ